MSSLKDQLANCSLKLRPTTTRITNCLGEIHQESKSEDGTFQTSEKLTSNAGIFMVIDTAPDEQLHRVIDGLYIGSQDAAVNKTALDECKITHIINVATCIRNAFPDQFEYLKINLMDLPETNIRRVFESTNDFIQQALCKNGHVLVHCNAGVSRSASIVLAYLLAIHRMTYEDAYRLLKSSREVIRPNEGFVKQLKSYAAEIAQANENKTFSTENP